MGPSTVRDTIAVSLWLSAAYCMREMIDSGISIIRPRMHCLPKPSFRELPLHTDTNQHRLPDRACGSETSCAWCPHRYGGMISGMLTASHTLSSRAAAGGGGIPRFHGFLLG